jgi:hypothetical protein
LIDDWFRKKFERATSKGFSGCIRASVARHHYYRQVWVAAANLPKKFKSVSILKSNVAQ